MDYATILVVDDEPAVRDTLEDIIEQLGHIAFTAEDGASARHQIHEERPDLIITDMNLPDMSGIDLLREIKSLHAPIPVAIITGYATLTSAVQAIQDGAYDYLAKPFNIRDLDKVISKGLRLRKGLREPGVVSQYLSHEMNFALPSRASLIEAMLTVVASALRVFRTCPARTVADVCLCLEEAMINAILHGNGLDDGRLVRVSVQACAEEVRVVVEDEGEGFDHAPFAACGDLTGMMKRGGHGLFLLGCLMDEVAFNSKGNAVTMIKRFPAADPHSIN